MACSDSRLIRLALLQSTTSFCTILYHVCSITLEKREKKPSLLTPVLSLFSGNEQFDERMLYREVLAVQSGTHIDRRTQQRAEQSNRFEQEDSCGAIYFSLTLFLSSVFLISGHLNSCFQSQVGRLFIVLLKKRENKYTHRQSHHNTCYFIYNSDTYCLRYFHAAYIIQHEQH